MSSPHMMTVLQEQLLPRKSSLHALASHNTVMLMNIGQIHMYTAMYIYPFRHFS